MPRGHRRGQKSQREALATALGFPEALHDRTERTVMFSRTKMCKFHILGMCAKGDGCKFAHHKDELNSLPDLSRTKLCKTLISTGSCEDPECSYAHNREELRSMPGGDDSRLLELTSAAEGRGGARPDRSDSGGSAGSGGQAAAFVAVGGVGAGQGAFQQQHQQQQQQPVMQLTPALLAYLSAQQQQQAQVLPQVQQPQQQQQTQDDEALAIQQQRQRLQTQQMMLAQVLQSQNGVLWAMHQQQFQQQPQMQVQPGQGQQPAVQALGLAVSSSHFQSPAVSAAAAAQDMQQQRLQLQQQQQKQQQQQHAQLHTQQPRSPQPNKVSREDQARPVHGGQKAAKPAQKPKQPKPAQHETLQGHSRDAAFVGHQPPHLQPGLQSLQQRQERQVQVAQGYPAPDAEAAGKKADPRLVVKNTFYDFEGCETPHMAPRCPRPSTWASGLNLIGHSLSAEFPAADEPPPPPSAPDSFGDAVLAPAAAGSAPDASSPAMQRSTSTGSATGLPVIPEKKASFSFGLRQVSEGSESTDVPFPDTEKRHQDTPFRGPTGSDDEGSRSNLSTLDEEEAEQAAAATPPGQALLPGAGGAGGAAAASGHGHHQDDFDGEGGGSAGAGLGSAAFIVKNTFIEIGGEEANPNKMRGLRMVHTAPFPLDAMG